MKYVLKICTEESQNNMQNNGSIGRYAEVCYNIIGVILLKII